ncbi:MAG TPA: dihydrodipicolinate reductase [Candidatus Polarisedimenticolia bacterium]|nr:dihydrodipicolinate reductase [Candidatus Polarisedimenticolia bacterium]
MASDGRPIRVLHFGLGPIGAAVARQVAGRKGFSIVGAVDVDPAKAGRDLGEVAGVGRPMKIPVSDAADRTLRKTRPDVVVLCTGSSLRSVMPQLEAILKRKVPIVSTTEELAYPTRQNLRYARAIHQLAKKSKVAVLGTGVNPGFVMDALPIMLTGVCERVEAIRVDRIQDARIRRLPFQQKIGAGLTREQFQRKVDDASVRHVGLTESISMIADALGWKLDRITDEIHPRIATETVASEFLAVDPGYVCGIVQDGIGYRDGHPVITLHMEAYLGAPESYDAVEVTGSPALNMKIAGGVHGDVATASIAVNSIPKILEVAPGLHTMRDMPLPSFFGGVR